MLPIRRRHRDCNSHVQDFSKGATHMALDEISAAYAAQYASMRPKAANSNSGDAAGFAALLPDEVWRASHVPAPAVRSDMTSRILQVGLERYIEEKKEVEKVMRVLTLVRAECNDELKGHLDKIIAKFKEEPPVNQEDALKQIKDYINEMPPGDAKQGMLKLFDRIKKLLAMSDEALEDLEKAQNAQQAKPGTALDATAPKA
jgi:hypothetical protein